MRCFFRSCISSPCGLEIGYGAAENKSISLAVLDSKIADSYIVNFRIRNVETRWG